MVVRYKQQIQCIYNLRNSRVYLGPPINGYGKYWRLRWQLLCSWRYLLCHSSGITQKNLMQYKLLSEWNRSLFLSLSNHTDQLLAGILLIQLVNLVFLLAPAPSMFELQSNMRNSSFYANLSLMQFNCTIKLIEYPILH